MHIWRYNSNKNHFIFSIIFCFSVLLFSCRQEASQNDELKIKAKDGVCLTKTFENNVWKFTLKGDMLDKTIALKTALPDKDAQYKVSMIVDYMADIEIDNLNLSVTTLTPDGNSSWNHPLTLQFHSDTSAKEIGTENGKTVKRITKEIYNQRTMNEEGEYTFEIYSSYSKMSLYGIKNISIRVEKQ